MTDHVARESAERRHLTVLFADVVDSVVIAGELDVADLRRMIHRFRDICRSAVARFQGEILGYPGDAVVAVFGFPAALDNSAQAAANAGLELLRTVAAGPWPEVTCAVFEQRGRPQVTVGIHTGITLVEATAGGALPDMGDVLGETPNIASRIQGAADPDTVLASEQTIELIREHFQYVSIGQRTLKGLRAPMELFQVISASSLVEQQKPGSFGPLFGRECELQALWKVWESAHEGAGRAVYVRGEAGIGKTRLVEEFKRRAVNAGSVSILELQCSPYLTRSAYFPIVEALLKRLGVSSLDPLRPADRADLAKFLDPLGVRDPEDVEELASLLRIGAEPETALTPQARKLRVDDLLIRVLGGMARTQPLIMEWSDVHWIDPSSLGVLEKLAASIPPRVMLAVTSRTAAVLETLNAPGRSILDVPLYGLGDAEAEELLLHRTGSTMLADEFLKGLQRITGGNPLFLETVVVELQRRWDAKETIDWDVIPARIHELLFVAIESLGEAKLAAQVASVIGRRFTLQLLARLWPGDPAALDRAVKALIQGGIVHEVSELSGTASSLAFRHFLLQNAAYESLLKDTRAHYHGEIARMFLSDPEMRELQSDLVAQHFTRSGHMEEAVPHWLRAAAMSLRQSANAECIAQCAKGLELIEELQSPERLRPAELLLATTMGTAQIAKLGFGSTVVLETFDRASRLAAEFGRSPETFPALWGLWVAQLQRGNLTRALDLAEQMLQLGSEIGDPKLLIEGHWTYGATSFWLGELSRAIEHLKKALDLYTPELAGNAYLYGQDPGVAARVYLTFALSYSGFVDDAVVQAQLALDHARAMNHPHSLGWALTGNTMLRLGLQDLEGVLELGEETIAFCRRQMQGFWLAAAEMMVGWARFGAAERTEGMEMVRRGFDAYRVTGAELVQPFFCMLRADCCMAAGSLDEAETLIEDGLRVAQKNRELCSVPGLLLARAALLLRKGPAFAEEARPVVEKALAMATAQQSRLRALQAAKVLVQLGVNEAHERYRSHWEWLQLNSPHAARRMESMFLGEMRARNG
ncbi:MAG TPA: AAA family ATPase [Verrucomicrobiales bacterium]|nr:AAA family ATPase [Verrucomicrobiales bacterium]